jgi:Arc/MetJ-type ribon-helix-helix transcriptional regulator
MRRIDRGKWELGSRVALDTGQPRITVRLRESMIVAIDEIAVERGRTRAETVRDLLAVALRDRLPLAAEPPTEAELLGLLAEASPRGNVSAARSLLARRGYMDPRDVAREQFQQAVRERSAS